MRRRPLLIRLAALAVLTFPVGAAAAANPTPPGKLPPSNTSEPTISGTPTVGATLTASPGAWSGPGSAYAFQWLRCDAAGGACASLAKETAATHVVSAAERGFTLRIQVTAKNKNGSAAATSAQTSVVPGLETPPPTTTTTTTTATTTTTPTTTTTTPTSTTTTTPTTTTTSAPGNGAAYADRVGFASHTAYLSEGDGAAFMQRSVSIGARWFREDFGWSWIEGRGKGQFDWTVPDRVMRNASKLGANVLAMVGYAPSWANGGHADDKYPPLNPRDYADFAVAVAKRYGTGGTFWSANPTLPYRPLAAIEIWNEPWLWSFWKPQPNVGAYAALVRAAAPAIKAAQPGMKVLVSGDLQLGYSDGRDYSNGTGRNWEYGFLAQLLKLDFASGSVDAYSVHAYCQNFSPYQTTISWFGDQTFAQQWLYQRLVLTRDMAAAAGKSKPLWDTEFGWSTKGDVDEATQATYLRGGLKRAVEEWGSFVERSFVFVLTRPDNSHYAGAYNLFHDDLTAKPAWSTLQTLLATGT